MKNSLVFVLALGLSTFATATVLAAKVKNATPAIVQEVAAKMAKTDVRAVIKEVENTDENPCMPSGKSFQVEIQVKQAAYDHEKSKVVYSWESVKTVGVDRNGRVMEVCAE